MNPKYEHRQVESKWQKHWADAKAFEVAESAPKEKKYYLLEMFPYPSGRIHMGHVRNYAIGDVVARYKMMQGFNVLHPMGWDAFGLPAENAAIEHGLHPAKWTRDNIARMRDQLKKLGLSYDWSREIATCDPEYYKWEQLVFIQMLEKGLAYKKKASVNWCPSCNTVLANEQVEQGLCYRCETPVEQTNLEQWFLKITHYADELLEWCDKLKGWPERVLTMQRNWIGKSYGAEIKFPLETPIFVDEEEWTHITVFTTRHDTVFGATFMSLAPEHPLTIPLAERSGKKEEISGFVRKVASEDKIKRSSEDYEKEGMFTGAYCINPMTGWKMPIYVANFVLMEYGSGAVMAVPAHDQRDFEFAKKYNLPIKVVVQPKEGESLDENTMEQAWEGPGVLVNSGPLNGLDDDKARGKMAEILEKECKGRATVSWRIRDWLVSRQRYWGAPIPVVYCDKCGMKPVKIEDLPVKLPENVEITGKGGSPLAKVESFVNTVCPSCGGPARRETDTFDTFMESNWYFLRFCSPHYDNGIVDKKKGDYWMPVEQYIGGIEHAILHLLYSRFYTKVLRDLGYINIDEPFQNLLTQGMVCKETQKCPTHGYLYPEEVKDGKCVKCESPIEVGRKVKMSKSLRNVVDPEELIDKYGADTARLFCLFAAPPEKDLDWSDEGVAGCERFLQRLWKFVYDNIDILKKAPALDKSKLESEEKVLWQETNRTLRSVTIDIEERFHFNTAIAKIMTLMNRISELATQCIKSESGKASLKFALRTLLMMLNPFAPHITEEIWEAIGETTPIYKTKWLSPDADALEKEELLIVVQVNGKLRGRITVPADASEEEIKRSALEDASVQKHIAGKEIRKAIYVNGKLLNIVV